MSPIKAAAATLGILLLGVAVFASSAFAESLWHEKWVGGVTIFFVCAGIVGIYKTFRIDAGAEQ